MGEKDSLTKRFMSRPDVVAAAFNCLIYGGRPVIKPEDLREMDTTAIAAPYAEYVEPAAQGAKAKASIQKYRDVMKEWVCMTDGKVSYVVLGVENQSHIHYAMPVKNMLYDAIQYENQVKDAEEALRVDDDETHANDRQGEYLSGFGKNDRVKPVITLVVYFGDKQWDGPMSLSDMLTDTDDALKPFVQDYKIHLISPYAVSEELLAYMASELREVMLYIKYKQDGEKLSETVRRDQRFKALSTETTVMLNVLTNSHIEIPKGAKTVDMCLALQQIEQKGRLEGREQGRLEGREQGRLEGREEGIYRMIDALRKFSLEEDVIRNEIMTQYGLTDEEARRFMQTAGA